MPAIPLYSYRVLWSSEDKEFVATYVEIPGLPGLAPTEAGAVDELKVAIGCPRTPLRGRHAVTGTKPRGIRRRQHGHASRR